MWGTGRDLRARDERRRSHKYVLSDGQYKCFMINVVDWGVTGTTCCHTQCENLYGLLSIDSCIGCARFPGGSAFERMGLMYCLSTLVMFSSE